LRSGYRRRGPRSATVHGVTWGEATAEQYEQRIYGVPSHGTRPTTSARGARTAGRLLTFLSAPSSGTDCGKARRRKQVEAGQARAARTTPVVRAPSLRLAPGRRHLTSDHGGLEAQDVFALGVGLQLQPPEADLEPAQAVLRFLDHDVLRGRAVLAVVMGPGLEAEQGPQRGDVLTCSACGRRIRFKSGRWIR
jgi:hypothetical protein